MKSLQARGRRTSTSAAGLLLRAALLLPLGFSTGCTSDVAEGDSGGSAVTEEVEPFTLTSWQLASKRARAGKRLVMIDFYTTWCEPCKELDKTTWKDEGVLAWLRENTIAMKIDAEKEVALAQRFGASGWPTMIFCDADGEEYGRITGLVDPTKFLAYAEQLVH